MSDAPFVEKPVAVSADTDESKAARVRLAAVLSKLDPASGKTIGAADGEGQGGKKKKARRQKT